MNFMMKKALGLLKLMQTRVFAVGFLSLSMAVTVYSLSAMTNVVYIYDGDQLILTYTTKEQPQEILEEKGITTLAYDKVDFSGFHDKEAEINIHRAFEVFLTTRGERFSVMVTGGTVGELLNGMGITPDGDDMLSHPEGMYVAPGDDIVYKEVFQDRIVEEEVLPYESLVRETSLIPKGRTRLLQSGSEGLKTLTYDRTSIDGELTQNDLVSEKIVKQPVDKITLKGTGAAISPLDFGPLDQSGKPVQYKAVLQNQVATGYNAGRGAWGASGNNLSYGHVAVNPAVIPYNSKLYITSSDGSFVYGYAIASDTGIGLLSGVIDVDLYYETYLESCLNGRRTVDIYILE